MRKWKDRLHRENKTLRAEVEKLKSELKEGRKRESEEKKEVERLKMRYEDVWKDKVMLAEQISVSTPFDAENVVTDPPPIGTRFDASRDPAYRRWIRRRCEQLRHLAQLQPRLQAHQGRNQAGAVRNDVVC